MAFYSLINSVHYDSFSYRNQNLKIYTNIPKDEFKLEKFLNLMADVNDFKTFEENLKNIILLSP